MLAALAALLFAAQPAAGQESADLSKLLPAADEISGWKTDGEPLFYTQDNLWEYIDGSAENFLSFDFRQVIAQDYVSAAGRGLKVEIYEHGSPLMAYGIYAQMRSPGLALHEIGNEAFSDEYSINFWKDRFYVRVAVFETGEESDAALEALRDGDRGRDTGGGARFPPRRPRSPRKGSCRTTLRYLTQGVLGREKFPPAFVGTYMFGGERGEALPRDARRQRGRAGHVRVVHGRDGIVSRDRRGRRTANTSWVSARIPTRGTFSFSASGDISACSRGSRIPPERGTELVKRMVERLDALDAAPQEGPRVPKNRIRRRASRRPSSCRGSRARTGISRGILRMPRSRRTSSRSAESRASAQSLSS